MWFPDTLSLTLEISREAACPLVSYCRPLCQSWWQAKDVAGLHLGVSRLWPCLFTPTSRLVVCLSEFQLPGTKLGP